MVSPASGFNADPHDEPLAMTSPALSAKDAVVHMSAHCLISTICQKKPHPCATNEESFRRHPWSCFRFREDWILESLEGAGRHSSSHATEEIMRLKIISVCLALAMLHIGAGGNTR